MSDPIPTDPASALTITIASEWEAFRKAIVPKDAPPCVAHIARQAFYAGFNTMLWVAGAMADPETNECLAEMARIRLSGESRRFIESSLGLGPGPGEGEGVAK